MGTRSNRIVEHDTHSKFITNNNSKIARQKNRFQTNVLYSADFEKRKDGNIKFDHYNNTRKITPTTDVSTAKKSPLKRPNKNSEFAKFNRGFFDNTTIGGLKRMFGKNRLEKWYRLFWAIMWLAITYFAYFLSRRHIENYYSFQVDTRMHYETMTTLDFPAITMCNENLFRKSVVGGSFMAMVVLANSVTTEPKAMFKIALENNKSCYQPRTSSLAKAFEKEGLNLLVKLGFKKFMRLTAMDTDVVAMKCWWQNVEMECSKVLLNRVADFNWCFTFNPSKHFLSEKSGIRYPAVNPYMFAFTFLQDIGIAAFLFMLYVLIRAYRVEPIRDNYVKREILTSGDRQGFRILLNTNQPEYCGAGRKYFNNPGFIVKLHHPTIMPYIKSDKSVYVGPGFSYKILLRPTVVERRTEHMGKCRSSMKSILYPDISGYFQDACKLEGLAKLIWDKCKCVAFGYDGIQSDISKLVDVPAGNLSLCMDNAMACAGREDANLSSHPVETIFPQCKRACREVHYESVISKSKIPSIIGTKTYQNELNFTAVKDVRKNAIQADFYFETMTTLIIEEYQMYSLLDLFRNFGGVLSLFLGVSVITLGEVVYITFYWFIFYAEFLMLKIVK